MRRTPSGPFAVTNSSPTFRPPTAPTSERPRARAPSRSGRSMAQKTGELDVMRRLLASAGFVSMRCEFAGLYQQRRRLERCQARPAAQAVMAAGVRAPSSVVASISPITAPNLKPWPEKPARTHARSTGWAMKRSSSVTL